MRGVVKLNAGNIYPFIHTILQSLFSAEERRLKNFIFKMNERNSEALGENFDAFAYQGKVYRCTTLLGRIRSPTLHESLQSDMDKYLVDAETIGNDKDAIKQLLFRLLEPSGFTGHFDQDVRDAIPECIIDTINSHFPEIASLPRMRPPAFNLKHPRDFHLYEKVLPKLEFYSAARLLY